MSKIVVDTSVIISGYLTKQIESKSLQNIEVIIPVAVLDELQSQASQGKEQGFVGLEEIKKINKICHENNITLQFVGQRPSLEDIRLAKHGRIDAIIKDVAKQNDAILYTADYVQGLTAEAEGLSVNYQRSEKPPTTLEFLRFFDQITMSVHLKEGNSPFAKKGKPGSFQLVKLEDKVLTEKYLEMITTEILEASKISNAGTIEISKPGALVVQYQDYRIAITRPPFSEAHEITIVHPITKMTLEQYGLSAKLMGRLSGQAEGIIISGPPGSGKSTLASSIANFYSEKGKIVKTFESPRDLQVNNEVTQYTKLDGSFENSADILLLVRPDYTIFDEVRQREDFRVFADLRLAGVGMVGVVHANMPLDAIQRFIGKIELGMIPSVIDTVVFVKDGTISKIYDLELKVKVPSGMVEQDLARPVIEIRDFETAELEYEIYTFGEENVIVPVAASEQTKSGIQRLASEKIKETIRRFDPNPQIEILSENSIKIKVKKESIPSLIGKGGTTISDLEKILHVHIDVEAKEADDDYSSDYSRGISFDFSESKNSLLFAVNKRYSGALAEIHVKGQYVTSARVARHGKIKISKRSDAGKLLMRSAFSKNDIEIFVKDS
ncbi:MAG: PINc/VapC family ATPase [Thermoproteota archaeon]|nr:PINc/VapC family ATPase [Candidatus Nitrosotenuis sp.]